MSVSSLPLCILLWIFKTEEALWQIKVSFNCYNHSEEEYNVFFLKQKAYPHGGITRGSKSVFPEDSFLRCCWYMCTRRQLLFFTCLPHCGQANGPRSSLCTSRMWMLRLDLLTKSREHSGHLTLRWVEAIHAQLSGKPVAQRKWIGV